MGLVGADHARDTCDAGIAQAITDRELDRISAYAYTPAVLLRLREWRERHCYSLRRLADLAGVSFTTVHRIETGQLSPTIEMLTKLATALEVDIHDLLPPRRKRTRRTAR